MNSLERGLCTQNPFSQQSWSTWYTNSIEHHPSRQFLKILLSKIKRDEECVQEI